MGVDAAHLTERSWPLQREQETLPGAGVSMSVVLQKDVLRRRADRKLQHDQQRQHWTPRRHGTDQSETSPLCTDGSIEPSQQSTVKQPGP